jgi:UDP-3-O-[3-hydroxymyristoyl] N-acetylglucosamine deacetylase
LLNALLNSEECWEFVGYDTPEEMPICFASPLLTN